MHSQATAAWRLFGPDLHIAYKPFGKATVSLDWSYSWSFFLL